MKEETVFYIDEDGNKFWYLLSKGRYHLHRRDGPAAEYINGVKYWYLNSKRHRIDGPAMELSYGVKEWWLNDKLIHPEEWFKENNIDPNNMDKEDQMAFILRWI